MGRNTAPCIGLAAAVLQARGAEADSMVVLPADHAIARVDEFRAVLAAGDDLLRRHDVLLTLGIEPRHAEPGYGYIRCGAHAASAGGRDFRRAAMLEGKPEEIAQKVFDILKDKGGVA